MHYEIDGKNVYTTAHSKAHVIIITMEVVNMKYANDADEVIILIKKLDNNELDAIQNIMLLLAANKKQTA